MTSMNTKLKIAKPECTVLREKGGKLNGVTVFGYMEVLINRLQNSGRIRTAETYASTLNSFRRFRQGSDLPLEYVSVDLMDLYQGWLRSKGLVDNTISFYLRILRATYNRASEEYGFENRYPFRKVYTGIDRTVKRALPIIAMRKLMKVDLKGFPAQEFARDLFLLSFMLRGMSFIDMAFLRKSDLRNGYVKYRRRKTGQIISICWTTEMQRIISKYPNPGNEYLLPILSMDGDERTMYKNSSYNVNRNLKIVGEKAGISISLTLYVARHSWASIARSRGVPLPVISQGLGHESETTTRIYLATLDNTVIDRANSRIIKSLVKTQTS